MAGRIPLLPWRQNFKPSVTEVAEVRKANNQRQPLPSQISSKSLPCLLTDSQVDCLFSLLLLHICECVFRLKANLSIGPPTRGLSLGKVNSSRTGPQLPDILGIGKSSMQRFLGETSHLVSLPAPLFLVLGSSTYVLFLWLYLNSRYFV